MKLTHRGANTEAMTLKSPKMMVKWWWKFTFKHLKKKKLKNDKNSVNRFLFYYIFSTRYRRRVKLFFFFFCQNRVNVCSLYYYAHIYIYTDITLDKSFYNQHRVCEQLIKHYDLSSLKSRKKWKKNM